MPSLTGRPLLVLTIVLAILAVLGTVVLVYLATRTRASTRARRLAFVSGALVLALLGPAFAVAATALMVNNSYGFYTSWADLMGSGPGRTTITANNLLKPGEGAVNVPAVDTSASAGGGRNEKLIVWLPPGYSPHAARPYPVVMFLPGQPSSPRSWFENFQFARIASALVRTHKMAPFVGVFPNLMIAPPRDTECTNIPGGAQAETWLNTGVPAYLTAHYHVAAPGQDWSVVGWSTGGFCAAKLATAHPGRFGSIAALGGYFTPLQDHRTGDLFGGVAQRFDHNSPLWLYQHDHGLGGSRLLIVAGRQDSQTWVESQRMLTATQNDPAVSHLVFPTGGHNYRNYRAFLAQVLIWGAQSWRR